MSRRGLIGSLLAAPAVITTPGLLMPVWDRTPVLWGDGVHDDTEGMRAFLNGDPFKSRPNYAHIELATSKYPVPNRKLHGGDFKIQDNMVLTSRSIVEMNNVSLNNGKTHIMYMASWPDRLACMYPLVILGQGV
jgi:hypothetical protein